MALGGEGECCLCGSTNCQLRRSGVRCGFFDDANMPGMRPGIEESRSGVLGLPPLSAGEKILLCSACRTALAVNKGEKTGQIFLTRLSNVMVMRMHALVLKHFGKTTEETLADAIELDPFEMDVPLMWSIAALVERWQQVKVLKRAKPWGSHFFLLHALLSFITEGCRWREGAAHGQ